MRSPNGALFKEKCIKHLRRFTFNTNGIPLEVVDALTIYIRDPLLRLKRGKKGPSIDQKEDKAQPSQLRSTRGTKRRLLSLRGSGGQPFLKRGSKPTPRLFLLPRGQRYMPSNICTFFSRSALVPLLNNCVGSCRRARDRALC